MAINKSEQSLEDQLVNRIKTLENQMLTLKTSAQPIGADMLDVRTGGTTTFSPTTLAAGDWAYWIITTYPITDKVNTIWNNEFTLFIDGIAHENRFPDGSFLTAGAKNCEVSGWLDWEDSDSTIGLKCFKIRAMNNDVVSHDFALSYIAIFPKFTLA